MVERITVHKKTKKRSHEVACGITGKTSDQATPAQVLRDNRGHWSIENSCHYVIDWNYEAKTKAASARAMDLKTSHDSGASLSASSKPKRFVASLKRCANSS